jgi:hypothetical protein
VFAGDVVCIDTADVPDLELLVESCGRYCWERGGEAEDGEEGGSELHCFCAYVVG